jgi:transketolase
MGIAEQDMVATAAGLASCGNKVILSTFAVFATMRACEQVRTFVCHPNLNVTILGTHTGLQVGGDGATHAAIEDVGIMRSFPNMHIIQPSDGVSAKALAHFAVDFEGPLYVRLHRDPVPDLYDPETFRFEFGKAITVRDYGTDLTLISSGIMLGKAIEAAERLREKGIGVRLLDMMTLKPLDDEAVIRAAEETGAIITIEDHNVINGLGAAVAAVTSENCPVPVKIIGIPDRFGESGKPELLYKACHMDADSIAEEAEKILQKKRR